MSMRLYLAKQLFSFHEHFSLQEHRVLQILNKMADSTAAFNKFQNALKYLLETLCKDLGVKNTEESNSMELSKFLENSGTNFYLNYH